MLRGWLGVQKSVLLFIPLKTQGPILLFTFFTASKPLLSKLIWNLPTGQFCWVFSISSFHLPSVQFSCSVMSDSLRPYGLRHARPPCPSPTPGACSNSCPLSRWCHPTVSFSVVPFSSRLQLPYTPATSLSENGPIRPIFRVYFIWQFAKQGRAHSHYMRQVAFLEQTGSERARTLPPVYSKWQAKPGLEPSCSDKVKLIKGQDLMHDSAQVTPDTGSLLSLIPGANHISFLFVFFLFWPVSLSHASIASILWPRF